MEGKHWGEFLDNSSSFTSPFLLSFDDVEKLSKDITPNTFSLNKTNVKAENVMTSQMIPITYFEPDAIIKHNIQLVQYSKQLEELLNQIQHSPYMKIHSDSIPPVPCMPVKQPIPPGQNIKLTRKGVQQLLHKSVFLTCAHEGFDRSSESVLATLVDVLDERLSKFCNLLKVNTEREIMNRSTGFTDAMERTLHDMGMNGIKDLHLFHVNRVLCYNDRLRSQGDRLRRACVKAASEQWKTETKAAWPTSWEDSEWPECSGNEATDLDTSFKKESDKSRVETTFTSEAVNQLHLEDNAVTLAPGLESGLRMLHTLEQQEASGSHSGRSFPHMILMEEDSVSPTNYGNPEQTGASPNIPGSSGKSSSKKKRKA